MAKQVDWKPFTEAQLARVSKVPVLEEGVFRGKLPDHDAEWADHVEHTKDLQIWVFFGKPAEQDTQTEVIEMQKEALRLLFEKCYLTELAEASDSAGGWVIVVRAPENSTYGRMSSISTLAKHIGYGTAKADFFGEIAKGHADELGLYLDVLLAELGE